MKASRADAADLAVLDTLLGSNRPGGIRQRSDLSMRTARTVWAARRGRSEAAQPPT
jgi:hypothetical protein